MADDLSTLYSMAALSGKYVYAQYGPQYHRIIAAYIGPPFGDLIWCYGEMAMPFSDKVGLFELTRNEFMSWEAFYRRYSPFQMSRSKEEALSFQRAVVAGRSGFQGGLGNMAYDGPNPLALLQGSMKRG